MERFREVENEADRLCAEQGKIIGLAQEVAKLREDNRRMTEQLAEVAEFRTKLLSFLPAVPAA